MPTERRVALLLDCQVGYCEQVLKGVARYADEAGGWRYRGASPSVEHLRALPRWKPHGVIIGLWGEVLVPEVAALNLPVVDVFNWLSTPHAMFVSLDNDAIARAAAEHLASRGLRHFAFAGDLKIRFARQRLEVFKQALVAMGLPPPEVHALESGNAAWEFAGREADQPLAEWLKRLPRPVGVLAANDDAGFRVLEACQRVRLRVPDDVAVLGVDNNDFLCNLSHPPLSSIVINASRLGYEAAKLLDAAMSGRKIKQPPDVPPGNIVDRQSTDTLAVTDPDVLSAVRTIRSQATRGLSVNALLKTMPMRRRTLERRFRALLGHGIHDEIVSARLVRARELIASSDLSMPAVADRCGFSNAERLSRVFRQKYGVTPSNYRKQSRPQN